MFKKLLGFGFVMALSLAIAPTTFALHSPEHYSLFDDAAYISPGNASARAVRLVSDASPGFGGISYGVEPGLTFAAIDALSTDYRFEADDTCGGGSPRFQINVSAPGTTTAKNIFVYIGPPPSYTGCPASVWINTGDLLTAGNTIDTSQLGGTFYDPYATAVITYGSYTVNSISLVADAGWAFGDGEQTVDIDNTLVDTTLFTYEVPVATSKDACKNGGWQTLADDQGNSFKNQGDCVSFVATQGKNKGSGV